MDGAQIVRPMRVAFMDTTSAPTKNCEKKHKPKTVVIDGWAALEAIKRERPKNYVADFYLNPATADIKKENIDGTEKASFFPVGATVRLVGLKTRMDLNGTLAIVMKKEENERIQVSCVPNPIAVKSFNLEIVSQIASEEMRKNEVEGEKIGIDSRLSIYSFSIFFFPLIALFISIFYLVLNCFILRATDI